MGQLVNSFITFDTMSRKMPHINPRPETEPNDRKQISIWLKSHKFNFDLNASYWQHITFAPKMIQMVRNGSFIGNFCLSARGSIWRRDNPGISHFDSVDITSSGNCYWVSENTYEASFSNAIKYTIKRFYPFIGTFCSKNTRILTVWDDTYCPPQIFKAWPNLIDNYDFIIFLWPGGLYFLK